MTQPPALTPPRPVFMRGFVGLLQKETLRFWRVGFQTVGAPILSTFLYIFIFSHVLGGHVRVYDGVSYVEFLAPGLVMMSVLQNAFANTSSSLIQSKVTGNLVLILLPPISSFTFFLAYIAAAVIRGVVVGAGVYFSALFFAPELTMQSPLWVLLFAVCGGVMTGALGIIAGLWAEKFDQIALFTNFIIMPLTFLSGVFYSIHSLPPLWREASHFNPFFYMIDGFRYGFFHAGDINPYAALTVTVLMAAGVSLLAFILIQRGYKIRA